MTCLPCNQGGLKPGNAVLGKRTHEKETRTEEKENIGKIKRTDKRGQDRKKRRHEKQGEK
jgi:hypothetical protein